MNGPASTVAPLRLSLNSSACCAPSPPASPAPSKGRVCGKSHVLNLEPEDLAAVTVEAAAMAQMPLAGTDWIPGR